MCVEHLIYPFLPQHVRSELAAGGFSESLAGLVITIYYLFFALTLVPAGYLVQRFGSRRVMTVGLLLTASGLLALVVPGSLLPLVLGRTCAGIGQALLLIGVQSYILAVAAPERRTQGAAIIVFGFQGGMIAGMAIGSLLVVNLGPGGVFALGAVAAALTALYARIVIPAPTGKSLEEDGLSAALERLAWELGQALRSRSLLATMGFVGIPAKAVLTGVVVFALPLLMTEQGYRHEDTGQMLMIYAGSVIAASSAVARLVDRRGRTVLVLGIGGLVSGLGLWASPWPIRPCSATVATPEFSRPSCWRSAFSWWVARTG
jgi:predicted MFS family arabinose efflux permease